MYARVTNLRFPPEMRMEMLGAAQGLVPVLRKQPGFSGIIVLSDRDMGEGIILSFWETEADAEASESSASYIGQMSMMSSFLYESLIPRTYEVDIRV